MKIFRPKLTSYQKKQVKYLLIMIPVVIAVGAISFYLHVEFYRFVLRGL